MNDEWAEHGLDPWNVRLRQEHMDPHRSGSGLVSGKCGRTATPTVGGTRFHCRHTLPDPDYPGSETFLHCHGSDGPSRDVYATSEAAMVACEQATARGLRGQNTPLGQLAREQLGIAADS